MKRRSAFLVCMGMFFQAALDMGAAGQSAGQRDIVTFDIPSQPLEAALERYGDLTGREVLYNSALVVGRRATAVDGSFSPEDALSRLLEGTGLSAEFLSDGSFVLAPLPRASQAKADAVPVVVQQKYYARIQTSLRNAFCENNIARAGNYRVVMKFWIGQTGDLARFERLGSAGNANLDQGIDETMRGLQIGASPPAGFTQPVLVMIVPHGRGVTMGCNANRFGVLRGESDR
jgi:hypothetical protein